MINPHDPPAVQRMDELLDIVVPEHGGGTPGGDLVDAIWDAILEAGQLALESQGDLILAVLRGDVREEDGDIQRVTRRTVRVPA